MKIHYILAILLVTASAVVAAPININRCGDLDSYRVTPYLLVASELQTLSKKDAIAQLQQLADSRKHNEQVVILCRMLFEAKENSEFRRPMLGGPQFYGNISLKDWPLEPITIIDNIPFKIVIGYMLAGHAEEAPEYLKYCLENAQWTNRIYAQRTKKDIDSAFQTLLKSNVWKKPLDQWQLGLIHQQIQG